MKHLGDITKIDGSKIPVVDVITGGSPCQDLSVAGKRAGLAGERSGLFMEQVRVVKEMREKEISNGRTGQFIRPRFMVWENVPGAFSSNRGKDFQAVLTEIIRIIEPKAPDVPMPDKGGWPKAGCLYGEMGDWSVAWRVHDAQFWGVPQRRKRISLVADFGGLAAPEVLFERKGVSGDSEPRKTARERAARNVADCARNADCYCLQGNGIDRADTAGCNGKGWREDVSYTLNTIDRPAVIAFSQNQRDEVRDLRDVAGSLAAEPGMKQQTFVAGFKHKASGMARGIGYEREKSQSLISGQECAVFDARGNGDGETACTITGDHQSRVTDYTALCIGNGQADQLRVSEKAGALNCMHDQQAVMCFQNTGRGWWNESETGATVRTPCGGDSVKANLVSAVDCRNGTENTKVNGTLQAKNKGGSSVNLQNVCRENSTVRRLTPLECERLQGFPDGWTDIGEWVDSKGKKHKPADSPRYKALGNSIALPFWKVLARKISAQYDRDITMGSLFDGIGGFPLAFQHCGGKALWASEIEKFPIAVTKIRFGEE